MLTLGKFLHCNMFNILSIIMIVFEYRRKLASITPQTDNPYQGRLMLYLFWYFAIFVSVFSLKIKITKTANQHHDS
jgi:hypothetical protein